MTQLTSNASVLLPVVTVPSLLPFLSPNFPSKPLIPGADKPSTTSPSVADRISSSDDSHDFIFSARLTTDEDDRGCSKEVPSLSPLSSAAAARRRAMENLLLVVVVKVAVAVGEKAYEAWSCSCTMMRVTQPCA